MTIRTLFRAAVAATVLAATIATSASASSAAEPFAPRETEQVAYVDVAVATLWVNPHRDRPVDAPSVANPVDMRAWTGQMSLSERRWLIGNLETQAVYGQRVIITKTTGDWVHVVVPGQPTPRDDRGYPGWMPRGQLTASAPAGNGAFAQVRPATTWLYDDEARQNRFMELSFNTRLPVLERTDAAVKVATPDDGDKWLSGDTVAVYESEAAIPAPSGQDLVTDAKLFAGLPYLWAGTSGFGYDCSGFTHSLYKAHGLTIPRDADAQLAAGKPVEAGQWQPGDLLFYGIDRIHHVGMYIGDGNMIDARTNSDTQEQVIEIVAVTAHPYADEYAGAVRFL